MIQVMAGPDFYQEIYEAGLREQLKYLSHGSHHIGKETDIVYRIDGKIAGVAGIWPNPFDDQVLWMPFLSVQPCYQRRGVATTLAGAVADYAQEQGKILQLSGYSEQGFDYLKRCFDRLEAKGYKILQKGRLGRT